MELGAASQTLHPQCRLINSHLNKDWTIKTLSHVDGQKKIFTSGRIGGNQWAR